MTSYSFDEEGVAFYFISTLVGFYVIPATFRLIRPTTKLANDGEPACGCLPCKEKRRHHEFAQKQGSMKRLSRVLFLAFLWIVFVLSLYAAWNVKSNFKAYDPFDILNVPSGASEAEIKKSFKKLSRQWHPDKVSEEHREAAAVKFVEISKAYKALTDERIRKNWEEYGNPDGIRSFALGVALPSWLVSSTNRVFVMALYCLAFGVGLPIVVRGWWGKSKKYTRDGLHHDTMGRFYRELKEVTSPRSSIY